MCTGPAGGQGNATLTNRYSGFCQVNCQGVPGGKGTEPCEQSLTYLYAILPVMFHWDLATIFCAAGLCGLGDGILLPVPTYPAFINDIEVGSSELGSAHGSASQLHCSGQRIYTHISLPFYCVG